MQRWMAMDAEIEAHNKRYEAGLESYSRQHTFYSDFSEDELDMHAFGYQASRSHNPPFPDEDLMMASASDSLDYRTHKILSPVRTQGKCGGCYAFASLAHIEAILRKKMNASYDLSVQDVIDCSYRKYDQGWANNACSGGNPLYVFYHVDDKDLVFTSQYRYGSGAHGKRYFCKLNKTVNNVIKGKMKMRSMRVRNEEELRQYLVSHGPLVIAMAAEGKIKKDLVTLGKGIFDVPDSKKMEPSHNVLLVGYGTENGKDYWLIQNSWGPKWGDGGFGKLRRGTNTCNIMRDGIWYIELK